MLLARKEISIRILARSPERAAELRRDGENRRYLPGFRFPDNVTVHSSPQQALSDSDCIIVAVPSVAMGSTIEQCVDSIPPEATIVSATKGLEIARGKRMSEVIAEVVSQHRSVSPEAVLDNICALSGPNLSFEIAKGLPALATAGSNSITTAERVQHITSSQQFRVYASDDIIGVELGGTLKNIVAIGAGVIDGSGLGANIKAAYVTRGLSEVTRLGVALGAKPATFAGLSGIGDILASCYSPLSRNYRLGTRLAAGDTLEQALLHLGQTAEGVPTTRATIRIAKNLGVEMPITEIAHRVLFQGISPHLAMTELMHRELQRE